MPRIIFKCRHIRPGTSKSSAHLNNYVRYVATREGAERLPQDKGDLPATKRQQAMTAQLLRDFPSSRGMMEYEDYAAAPTRANASAFISRAVEENLDQIAQRENYVDYIAKRPRAERMGSHGLFDGTDEVLELPRIAEEVAGHPGTVWLPIISLRREDAARLGYDNARQWRELLAGYAPKMAEAMKIPPDQFRWYAAFHDEGHHPHIHMVCYSADGRSGFLSQEGIEKVKSGLAQEIFRQELVEIYRKQTLRRDELTRETRDTLRQLILQMQSGTLENPRIEQLMGELARRLKGASGKKQYGYLKAPLKSLVDEIVDELARDPRIDAAYDLWYRLREDVLRTYKDDLPDRLPLSQQKEFKRIKNLVIEEAVRLGGYMEILDPLDEQEMPADDQPLHDPQSDAPKKSSTSGSPCSKYRAANRILADPAAKPDQIANAIEWLTQAAEAGAAQAQYALGRLFRDGGPVEQDRTQAVIWFSEAAQQGSQHAQYALGKMFLETDHPSALRWFLEAAEAGNQYAQYALGKLYLLGKDVPQDREAAIRWFTLAAEQGNQSARFFLNHMDDTPSLFASAARLFHHIGRIFQDQTSLPAGGIFFVDSKLRRKIREKKIAMGHKADDHETQTQQFRS